MTEPVTPEDGESGWDPGNSPPAMWSEPLTEDEDVEVRELLQERREDREQEREESS